MLRTSTQIQSFRGQTDGSYETRTFMGQDYYVVPVVAMVEGVRFGANQSSAELGLASEFGKFVDGWNNSPIVLGHPKVDGNFVSASSPTILETYQIGFMSGSRIDEKKLKCEAWLLLSRRDHSAEAVSVFERVEAGTMIEVSVGFFTDLEEKSGTLNGQEYSGIWRNIVPDHLAFLEEGVLGACSIEDGCGTPRVNQVNIKEKVAKMFRTDKSKAKGKKMKKDVSKYMNGAQETECSCQDKSPAAQATQAASEVVLETTKEVRDIQAVLQSIAAYSEKDSEIVAQLVAQVAPEDMLSSDVYSLLSSAINDIAGHNYVYLYGFTATHALYNQYDDGDWCMLRLEYSITDDGVVTFTGDPQEVRLITKIIPVDETAGDGITANSSTTGDPMTTKTTETAPAAETTAAVVSDTTATTATAEASPKVEAAAPKVLTEAEYIASAPAGVREVLEASLKVHNDRKNGLITALTKNERNTFSEAYLKAQSLETLEGLAKLAAVPVDYSGVATPASRAQAAEDDKVPAAPIALVRKEQA